jgi:hypothetical protein
MKQAAERDRIEREAKQNVIEISKGKIDRDKQNKE